MVLRYQCNIDLQDCPTLYPEGLTRPSELGNVTVKFTKQSCVRDLRVEGKIGRCGYPGALCVVNETASNCASGSATTCVQGICQGAPGYPCHAQIDCNYAIPCNATWFGKLLTGVCGGADAGVCVNDSGRAQGLDIAKSYCISGNANITENGCLFCNSGPPVLAIKSTYEPTFPTSKFPPSYVPNPIRGPTIDAIIGIAIGALAVALCLLLLRWRLNRKARSPNPKVYLSLSAASQEGHETTLDAPRPSREHESASSIMTEVHLASRLEPFTQAAGHGTGGGPNPLNGSNGWDLAPSSELSCMQAALPHSLQERGVIRRDRAFQILLFLILELAYFAILIIVCIWQVLLPQLPEKRAEIKGLITILTISWQALALFPVRDIITDVVASEWYHAYSQTQELIPGKTDRVSTRTAGFYDHTTHFFTSTTSSSFRLAFVSSIVALLIGAIAPGALSVDTISVGRSVRVDVGSISTARNYHPNVYPPPIHVRAQLATQMEQVERRRFNIMLAQPSAVVGFPTSYGLMGSVGNLTYSSDVAWFDYACRWAAPTLVDMTPGGEDSSVVLNGTWSVERKAELWRAYFSTQAREFDLSETLDWGLIGTLTTAVVVPMEHVIGSDQSRRIATTPSGGTSAWLFIGGNSSSPLDLSKIPSTRNSTHHWTIGSRAILATDNASQGGTLASMLVCDPRMNISSSLVKFSPESNSLTIIGDPLGAPVGNISPGSAANMFSQSLLQVTSFDSEPLGPHSSILIGSASRAIFTESPQSLKDDSTGLMTLRSISDISSNIGSYVSSASKAWSDGYWGRPDALANVTLDGTKDMPTLALIGSIPLTVATGVLIVIISTMVVLQLRVAMSNPLGISSLLRITEQRRARLG